MADLPTILSWFETDDIPTQEQFQQTLSSFFHKDEDITMAKIAGLVTALNNKLGNNHAVDLNAHNEVLACLDASNLDNQNIEDWRTALGVGDIPDNVALVDIGEPQEVYNKAQIHEMTMMLADYVVSGKIRADKIEALGLTDLIAATETTLATFVANSGNYEFQKNDFIAIPNGAGNHSLFIFKGGVKTVQANYLPTGLTNITIAMVDGLQAALDNKIDKPASDGSFFTKKVGSATTQRLINPSVNYLLFWNGVDFSTTNIFRDPISGRMGIGTASPSEQMQLMGRLRTAALVLDENSEGLPQQITYNNRKFYGTDSTGQKRQLMFRDYEDFLGLANSLTEAEKTAWKTAMNGGFTTNTMSVALINPPVINNTINQNDWILIKGANLNLNPTNFSVKIVDINGVLVATVPNSQVQLYPNGTDLIFYFNFSTIPSGTYKIKLNNGIADYVSGITFLTSNVVETVNVNALGWTKLYSPSVMPQASDLALGRNANITMLAGTTSPNQLVSFKSDEIFPTGRDWIIEVKVTINTNSAASVFSHKSYIGMVTLDTPNALAPISLISLSTSKAWNSTNDIYNNDLKVISESTSGTSINVTFIKQGNIFRTVIGNSQDIRTINTSSGFALVCSMSDRDTQTTINAQIIKAEMF